MVEFLRNINILASTGLMKEQKSHAKRSVCIVFLFIVAVLLICTLFVLELNYLTRKDEITRDLSDAGLMLFHMNMFIVSSEDLMLNEYYYRNYEEASGHSRKGLGSVKNDLDLEKEGVFLGRERKDSKVDSGALPFYAAVDNEEGKNGRISRLLSSSELEILTLQQALIIYNRSLIIVNSVLEVLMSFCVLICIFRKYF
jgi:hypothetical protein